MVQMTPGNLPGLPVEQLAQFLLGCAKDDPALLARSNVDSLVGGSQKIRLPPGRRNDGDTPGRRTAQTGPDGPASDAAGEASRRRPVAPHESDGIAAGQPNPRLPLRRSEREPLAGGNQDFPLPADHSRSGGPLARGTPVARAGGNQNTPLPLNGGDPDAGQRRSRRPPRPADRNDTVPPPGGPSNAPLSLGWSERDARAGERQNMPPASDRPETNDSEAGGQPIPPALGRSEHDEAAPGPLPPGWREFEASQRAGHSAPPPGPSQTGAVHQQPANILLPLGRGDTGGRGNRSSQPPAGQRDVAAGSERDIRIPLGKPEIDASKPPESEIRLPPSAKPEEAVPLSLRLRAAGDPELEELVSIAVACARRAEDALQHAREVSGTARRRMSLIAAVTSFTVIAATAGIGLERYYRGPDARMSEIASAMSGVTNLQRETFAQLAEVRSDVAALHDSPAADPATPSDGTHALAVAAPAVTPIPTRPPEAGLAPAATATRPAAMTASAASATHTGEAAGEFQPAGAAHVTRAVAVTAAAPPAPVPPDPVAPAQASPPRPAELTSPVTASPAGAVAAAPPGTRARPEEDAGGPVSGATPAAADATPVQGEPDTRVADASSPEANDETAATPRPVVSHPVRHYYRPPVRRVIYYRIDPPYMLAQVVANVRRNIYEIFH